ncbi:MAG: hypothetical protein P8174_01485 [Gemmatimonadota bacterium]
MTEAGEVSPDGQRPGPAAGGSPREEGRPPRLTPAQRAELAAANERAEKILRACRVATFNGWTIGTFGALSVLLGLGSLTALVVGACLLVVAWNEFRGRDMLRRFQTAGARLLGRNQLGLMAVIIAYCLWSIHGTLHHPGESIRQLEEFLGGPGSVTHLVAWGYAAVIVLSVLAQGLNARYYFARVEQLATYLAGTPAWIVELQRATTELRK